MKVYLDMDGVLADFVEGLHEALYLGYSYHKYPYTFGAWDVFAEIEKRTNGGVSQGRMYDLTSYHNFWATLPWMNDGKEILKTVTDAVGKQERFICTSPMNSPECWSGKIEWLKAAGVHRNTIIMSAPKSLLAGPDCALIDDKDENVEEFIAAGGKAYLIPRPWNKRHPEYKKPFMNELKAFLGV